MNEVYLIFHSWLLYLNKFNFLFKQHDSNFESIEIVHELEWKVEKIFDFKLYKKKVKFNHSRKKIVSISH